MVQMRLDVLSSFGSGEEVFSGNRLEVVERFVSVKWPLTDRKSRVAAHLKPPAVFPFVVAVAQNWFYELEILKKVKCVSSDSFKFKCLSLNFT